MGFILRLFMAALVAAGLGVWSALSLVDGVAGASAVNNGAWSINTSIGSDAAGPYTRAMIARRGLPALDKSEAIYFFAETDDAGEPLSGACTYTVEGPAPPALWSSLTVYGADDFLIPNDWDRWSYALTPLRDEEGRFSVRVGPDESEGAWLPVVGSETFSLTLRLYQPDSAVVDDPAAFAAPRIVKGACQ